MSERQMTGRKTGPTGFMTGPVARFTTFCRARSWQHMIGILAVVLTILIAALPSPYVVEGAGPTFNVMKPLGHGERIVQIQHAKTYEDSGQLRMVTVSVTGVPGYPVTNTQALIGWANPHETVVPSEVIFPVGQSAKDYAREGAHQMSTSEHNAVTSALAYARNTLHLDVPKNIAIHVNIEEVGGPSAGLIYTLAILDELTPQAETGGQVIAGTGTMNERGMVGPIGGIRLKMLGALRDGARWFLAPISNCQEVVGHVPQGLRDVAVKTLDDAYRAVVAIGQGKGDTLPHCTLR